MLGYVLALLALTEFSSAALASTGECSLTKILQQSKPDKKCVKQYLDKIPNVQDHSEAKFHLSQWKPMPNLRVISTDGMIEAYNGDKLLLRTILLRRQKPMLLWMNGKILVDNSGNPSFARRLDSAIKRSTSSAFDFLLPRAHAASGVNKEITLFYALDDLRTWGDPIEMVQNAEGIDEFLPAPSWLGRLISGAKEISCSGHNTVGRTTFARDSGYAMDQELTIIPKSETEFIVKGLKRGQAQLIKLRTWEFTLLNQSGRIMSPKNSLSDATISTCADPDCKQISTTDPLESWNFSLRLNAKEEEKARQSRIASNNESFAEENKRYRTDLAGKLFGLSVMGSCCASPACRKQMEDRYSIQLQPAAEPRSTR